MDFDIDTTHRAYFTRPRTASIDDDICVIGSLGCGYTNYFSILNNQAFNRFMELKFCASLVCVCVEGMNRQQRGDAAVFRRKSSPNQTIWIEVGYHF